MIRDIERKGSLYSKYTNYDTAYFTFPSKQDFHVFSSKHKHNFVIPLHKVFSFVDQQPTIFTF